MANHSRPHISTCTAALAARRISASVHRTAEVKNIVTLSIPPVQYLPSEDTHGFEKRRNERVLYCIRTASAAIVYSTVSIRSKVDHLPLVSRTRAIPCLVE